MADTDSPLAQVDHLLQQREQYEQWLARLDGTGSKAPDAVRQKVRADYQARLDAVLVELRSHASSVEEALSGHNEALASLEARQTDIQERLAEAEIRHAVGEYTDDEWGAVGAEAEAALDEIGRRIGAEQGEITRLSAVLQLVAEAGDATGGSSAGADAPGRDADAGTGCSRAGTAGRAASRAHRGSCRRRPVPCRARPTPMPPPPKAAAPVDELAFLKSVTGEHPTPRKAPPKKCPTAARCGRSTSRQEPPAVAVDSESSERPRRRAPVRRRTRRRSSAGSAGRSTGRRSGTASGAGRSWRPCRSQRERCKP